MNPLTTRAFDLPDRLAAKADPALIAADERHFAAIADSLEQSIADLSGRLEAELRAPGGIGQKAMDRDTEVHRLSARLRTLRRFGLDLCLGRMVGADDGAAASPEPVYVGRLGLTDSDGRRLLVDWRSPVAEPFFGATHANPMGLASRRRYRWTRGRVSDYWDEVFTADGLEGHAALDDQSAFIASLGGNRSARMRDVLGTIAADQDAIIRAGSRGALVVDGGPGTGKTVVALHRCAYLLYSDPRLGHRRGGVLFVGPHQPYLAYVSDVLPSLGEEGVQTCTLRDLVPEGAAATPEADPEVARLKSSADLVKAIEAAVRFYENPPAGPMTVETPWSGIQLSAGDWAEAFDAAEPGTAHNEAREAIWSELLTIAVENHEGDAPADQLRRSLQQNRELRAALNRAWPLIEPADLVSDLWTVPAYLRKCAPWLSREDVRKLQRADGQAWTVSDLPLLDAARQRLGDPEAARRKRRQEAAAAAEREQMDRVVDTLIEVADDEYGMGLVTMLRGEDFTDALVNEAGAVRRGPGPAGGPVRAHRRRRGAGADRRRMADAAAALPVQELHHRRGPRPGQARVHRVVAGTARAGRPRPDHPGLAEHQLPHAGGGHGRGRAGHQGGAPGRQRADLDPQRRPPGHPRLRRRARPDPRPLARRPRRGDRLRHRRSRLPADRPGPVADPGAGQGTRVRPRRPRRPGRVRHRHRGRGRPLRRDDQGDPAARHPHERLTPDGRRPRDARAAGSLRTARASGERPRRRDRPGGARASAAARVGSPTWASARCR